MHFSDSQTRDLYIEVSDTVAGLEQSSALFYHRGGTNSAGQPETFIPVSPMDGRYVRLRRDLDSSNYFCLLELEVYGGKINILLQQLQSENFCLAIIILGAVLV